MTTQTDWLADRVAHIKGLKSPSEQQQLLVLLAEKPQRDENDEKKLKAIIRAEKATERASRARVAAAALIQKEKDAARKARDHEMYKAAGLLGMAGLLDKQTGKPLMDAAELLGGLLGLAHVSTNDPELRQQWREAGAAMLAQTKKE